MELQQQRGHKEKTWLGLSVGNSRLHWAWFTDTELVYTWETDYLPRETVQQLAQCQSSEDFLSVFPHSLTPSFTFGFPPPLLLASVVPSQTALWANYPNVDVITLDCIPLQGTYPTLGIDRVLTLWGAGQKWGFPILVIDAGTALTFSGADTNCSFVGGAILPGLGLQFATLADKTGQLPAVHLPQNLPKRYATNTQEAIQSGVIYCLTSGIQDFMEAWWHLFPNTKVVMTGGDRNWLANYLQSRFPQSAKDLIIEPNLVFLGMQKICQSF